MAKTIIFGNQKGGVAKTTSTYNVAAQLALKGYRVLMIDTDHQASLTIITGNVPEAYVGHNLTALLYDQEGKVDIHDCIISLNHILPSETKGTLAIISCDIAMACGDLDFVSRPRNSELLGRVLKRVADEYDYICIDCPPSLGIISINDISASDYIIGCVEPGFQAYSGIGYYKQIIDRHIYINEFDTKFLGVIIAKSARNNDSKDLTELLYENYKVLGEVPLTVEVSKGEIDGYPVSIKKPGQKRAKLAREAAKAYSNITDNIIKLTQESEV